MHACLNVDEILRLIVCKLVGSGARATAVALACCCKGFEDSVLDALWETQGGLLPLLDSLPADVWNEGGYTVSVPTPRVFSPLNHFIEKSFKRHPTTLEWARFRKYARKIRELRGLGGQHVQSSELFSILERCAISEPSFPYLKTLELWRVTGKTIPFIHLILSPRTTIIKIGFIQPECPTAMIASMVSAFPILCPNLQEIGFDSIPRDPMITAAVSGMLLANNRKMVLPSLTTLVIGYDGGGDWLSMFHGATFGKLETITFCPESEQIDDPLEAFKKVALTASIQNTLSQLHLYTSCSWNPNHLSVLPFTQLTNLVVEFSCNDGCSSRVDDDIITNLARAMPKLDTLRLGDAPCREIPTGVTVEGLVTLANHCPDLYDLCIHFQVDSLSASECLDVP